jgi:hypothetical protein
MRIYKIYCDFCNKDITEDKTDSKIIIARCDDQWNIESKEHCFECFNKIYTYISDLKNKSK